MYLSALPVVPMAPANTVNKQRRQEVKRTGMCPDCGIRVTAPDDEWLQCPVCGYCELLQEEVYVCICDHQKDEHDDEGRCNVCPCKRFNKKGR